MELTFMEFSKLDSYKVLNAHVFFAYLFAYLIFEIFSEAPILISSYFKMLVLGILKLRNIYIFTPCLMYLFVSALYWVLL